METWPAIDVGGHGLVLQRRQRRVQVQAEVDEPVAVPVVPLPFDLNLICNFFMGARSEQGQADSNVLRKGGPSHETRPRAGRGRGSWFVDVDGDGDGTYLVWFQRLKRWAWPSQRALATCCVLSRPSASFCISVCKYGMGCTYSTYVLYIMYIGCIEVWMYGCM